MNQIFFSILTFLAIGSFLACGSETGGDTPGAGTDTNEVTLEEETTSTGQAAICLWPKVGLRDAPGMGGDIKYLTTVYFGEAVNPTGETKKVKDETYIKVKLSNGDEGWLKESLFALDASTQVVVGDIDVYPRPDLMTYKGDKFKKGDVLAVTNKTEGDWVEVIGMKKSPKGWIKEVNNLSDKEIDVTVGVLYNRAMQEEDKKKRAEQLNNIATNSSFSASGLMSLIDETLAGSAEPPRPELPANQAYIDADVLNVRSEADVTQDNVLFQVKNGDVVEILERGDRVPLNGMDDYWYLIRFNGQEGWIYGAHTSKKL
jgi:uncharacterized protein YgiM (DUF1202 family)